MMYILIRKIEKIITSHKKKINNILKWADGWLSDTNTK